MKTINISKALREVWEWKDEAYREIEKLDITVGIQKRLTDSLNTTKASGLTLWKPSKTITAKKKVSRAV
jgi:hypothetical protein